MESVSNYAVGVDGGGTKTDFVLVNHRGEAAARFKGGASNYQVVGGSRLKSVIEEGVAELCRAGNISPGNITRICLGLAGAGRKSDQDAIRALFDASEFAGRVLVDSDAMAALAGAFGNRPGVIIISGTGSICFGKDEAGNVYRSGGWGYLLGDEGSGYYIGSRAVMAALKDHDGRGGKTILKQIIKETFNLATIEQIIPKIYQGVIDRPAIADLTPRVFKAAAGGDSVAFQIIEAAGIELGKQARAVAQQIHFASGRIKVALIGGVFTHRDKLTGWMRQELSTLMGEIDITDPRFTPAAGAAILALEAAGVTIDDDLLARLQQSLETPEDS